MCKYHTNTKTLAPGNSRVLSSLEPWREMPHPGSSFQTVTERNNWWKEGGGVGHNYKVSGGRLICVLALTCINCSGSVQ